MPTLGFSVSSWDIRARNKTRFFDGILFLGRSFLFTMPAPYVLALTYYNEYRTSVVQYLWKKFIPLPVVVQLMARMRHSLLRVPHLGMYEHFFRNKGEKTVETACILCKARAVFPHSLC